MDKTFLKIFDKAGKLEIGRKFSRAVLKPFLIIGKALATFRLFGKIPNLNDVSIKYVKKGEIISATSLTK